MNDKLNLGCFDTIYEGWLNTDITPHIKISKIPFLPFILFRLNVLSEERYNQHKKGIFRKVKYVDVTKRFPFSDNSFSYVFTSHMIEHLYPDEAINCLKEIYRTLRAGGIVRIAIPDLDYLVHNYRPEDTSNFLKSIFESDQKSNKNQHHWHYNEKSLTKLLRDIGFAKVKRCSFQKGDCVEVEIIDNRPESLFIEAIK